MPYIIIGFIVFVLSLKKLLKLAKVKGYLGEKQVDRVLKQAALKHGGLECWDMMFEDDRSSSQVDNLLLTQKALYVCEVKNYRGRIFGSPTQEQWTMTLLSTFTKRNKRGRKVKKTHLSKHRFYNPIRQNTTHIKKIKHVLTNYPEVPIINLVVFGPKADVSNVAHLREIVPVKHLLKTVASIESSLTQILSTEDQIDIIDTLFGANITDKRARKAHVKNLKIRYGK